MTAKEPIRKLAPVSDWFCSVIYEVLVLFWVVYECE